MTWQHCQRTFAFALFGAIALILGPQARAEDGLISPEQAETLVRAQIEEQKAAAAAQKEEEAAIAAEEAKAAKVSTAKAGTAKASKVADKKVKEAVVAAKTQPSVKSVEEKVGADAQEAAQESGVEETATLPVALPALSRSARGDAAKASALKPLIARYASENDLPYELADAVVRLESRYNPSARNGPNLGLTQVNFRTAQSLGYKGDAAGLFDAETNLRYGLKYLAQAYRLAGGDTCGTILRYQFGHRTTTMTSASRAYCAKVKVITAAAE